MEYTSLTRVYQILRAAGFMFKTDGKMRTSPRVQITNGPQSGTRITIPYDSTSESSVITSQVNERTLRDLFKGMAVKIRRCPETGARGIVREIFPHRSFSSHA